MSSPEPAAAEAGLDAPDRRRLLDIAWASVDEGLARGRAAEIDPSVESPALRSPGASFVTLRRDGALRGCIGSLEPCRPLACDVAENAFRSAFRDPRFPPLQPEERVRLDLHISVLGPHVPLPVESEEALVASLRPGVDGLVLMEGAHRATFLPAVWESLPDPCTFVRELKRKAGLPADHWSSDLRFWRYRTESIP